MTLKLSVVRPWMWKNFVLAGPPGVGKTVYGRALSEFLSKPHISMGDLLRAEMSAGTEIGLSITSNMNMGQFVPTEIMAEVLARRLKRDDCTNGAILDGVPRSSAQLGVFFPEVVSCPGVPVAQPLVQLDGCLELKLPLPIVQQKLGGRRVCSKCGMSWNVCDVDCVIDDKRYLIPANRPSDPDAKICNIPCAGPLQRRVDDEPATVAARYDTYEAESASVAAFFAARNALVVLHLTRGFVETMDELKTIFTPSGKIGRL